LLFWRGDDTRCIHRLKISDVLPDVFAKTAKPSLAHAVLKDKPQPCHGLHPFVYKNEKNIAMIHDMIERAAYMAHGYCLLWKPWLIASHASSDLLIFGAYSAIPVAIFVFIRRRKDLELKPLAFLFAAFIFLCGLTHLIQGVTLWWPVYETQAYVKVATAMVSVATAIAIFPLIPKALAIPSPRQLQTVNDGLAAEIEAHRRTLSELARAKEELERRAAERTKELELSKARFEALVDASAQLVWTCDAAGNVVEDSPSWRAFTGQTREEWIGTGWSNAVHPRDREATIAAWRQAIKERRTYSVEYRLRHSALGWRWMAAKAVPLYTDTGVVREWVGMNIDIDERKRAERHMMFVMRELSHRTKNILAVVYSMAHQAAKQPESVSVFLKDFMGRIQGLSRSHDLLVNSNWSGVSLAEHVKAQLAPFAPRNDYRIQYAGVSIMLRPEATQALGLAFHELATNAAKHGALAQPDGTIKIEWTIETIGKDLFFRLIWQETWADARPIEVVQQGFGYTILTRVVCETLSGETNYVFDSHGLSWELRAPLDEVETSGASEQDLSAVFAEAD
jgi:PAS domain S-box-containing protein